MSARTRPGSLRSPRTTQERRANQYHRFTGLVRGKRRNLPNAHDDIFIRRTKCWKAKRSQQYRDRKMLRHEQQFTWRDPESYLAWRQLLNRLERLGIDYTSKKMCVVWLTPAAEAAPA